MMEGETASRYCWPMKGTQLSSAGESSLLFGNPAGRLRGGLLVLVLALTANGRALAEQSGTSRVDAIHDHLRKAAGYLKANDTNSAVKEFETVLSLDPGNLEANADLGVTAFFRGDYPRASEYLGKALAVEPSLVKAQALLGMCERRLGQRSAQARLEQAFPKLKEKNLQVEVGLELANLYYQQGSLDRAAAVMRSLVDLDPDNVEVLFMTQRVYSDLANDTLNKLAILAPGSARMEQLIAQRLVNEGNLKEATEHYRKALEINPRVPGVHHELAEAIFASAPDDVKSQAEAEKELETAVKLDGANSRIECAFARIASRRGDLDGAYAHYSRAFDLNPGDAEAQGGLGRLLAIQEKFQEAAKYLRLAVRSDPLNDETHYRLASVCRRLQLKDEAEKEFRLSREIKQARERLGELYWQMNRKPPVQEDHAPAAIP